MAELGQEVSPALPLWLRFIFLYYVVSYVCIVYLVPPPPIWKPIYARNVGMAIYRDFAPVSR